MLFWSFTSCQQSVISVEEAWESQRGPDFPISRNSKCMSKHALICTMHLVFIPTITQRILKWFLFYKGGATVSKLHSSYNRTRTWLAPRHLASNWSWFPILSGSCFQAPRMLVYHLQLMGPWGLTATARWWQQRAAGMELARVPNFKGR